MAGHYQLALFRDIEQWWEKMQDKRWKNKVKTIYFGGWTPLLLWGRYLIDIMSKITSHFDISELEELSIECNPYPYEETLLSVQDIAKEYSHVSRVRFSFGIQSLDDEVLTKSNRDCSVEGIMRFTEKLLEVKTANMLYNYDFISFGTTQSAENKTKNMTWLQNLIDSKKLDSFSLYTLELFAGAKRYHETKDPLINYQSPWDHAMPFTSSEDTIFDEFTELKTLFLKAWYQRYEISNYALPGKESMHNMVYWTMWSYLWLGLWAHSLLREWFLSKQAQRLVVTWWRKNYIHWDAYKATPLSQQDILIESFFLALRTMNGVDNLDKYSHILHEDRQTRVQKLVSEWLATYEGGCLSLTDTGMNVHHRACDYLMAKI
jgi:oxygen-independent coproporphyrinogen III oxidase